jgi:uncharacterized protein (DUF1697 family)
MAELRILCDGLGFKNVETYLQSGNVLVDSPLPAAQVGKKISSAIADEFDYPDVDILVLSPAQLKSTIDKNPFAGKKYDESKVYVTFLQTKPDAKLLGAIDATAYLPDTFITGDGLIYVYCPGGYGKTKLNNGFFERKLKAKGTTRNWKSTNELYALSKR